VVTPPSGKAVTKPLVGVIQVRPRVAVAGQVSARAGERDAGSDEARRGEPKREGGGCADLRRRGIA